MATGPLKPLGHRSNCNRVVEPAHRKTQKHLIRNMFPLLMLCYCFMCRALTPIQGATQQTVD